MSNKKTNYFGRCGWVELAAPQDITDTSKPKFTVLKGLDFKFDISKPVGAVCLDAKISVLGLSWDNIVKYATYAADAIAYAKKYRIRVFAGYGSDENAKCIFDGYITRAMPATPPPDIWLEITARSGLIREFSDFSQSPADSKEDVVTAKEYFKKLCDFIRAGCNTERLKRQANIKLKLPIFPKASTHKDVVKMMIMNAKRNDIIMIETVDDEGRSTFKFMDRYSSKGSSPDDPIEVSVETGMIGIPQMNWAEITVRRLLTVDKLDVCGNFLRVKSRMALPGLLKTKGERADEKTTDIFSADFLVNNVRYIGHMRGNEWYVEYKAWRNWSVSDEGKKESVKSAVQHTN